MKKHIIYIIFGISLSAFSQQENTSFNSVYDADHFSIEFCNIWSKFETFNEWGKESLYSRYTWGYMIGIDYMVNFSKYAGFKTGLYFGRPRYNFVFNPDDPRDYLIDIGYSFLEIPYRINVRYKINPWLYLAMESGFSFRNYPRKFGDGIVSYALDEDGNSYKNFETTFDLSYSYNLYLFYLFNYGVDIIIAKKHLVKVYVNHSFVVSPSWSLVFYGDYRYYDSNNHVVGGGELYTGGNYFGIDISYSLLTRKKWKYNKFLNKMRDK